MKKPHSLLLSLLVTASPLFAISIEKNGTLPVYSPYANSGALLFLPYNPNALIVTERCSKIAPEIAKSHERSKVYCFTPSLADFQKLQQLKETMPNIHANFGFIRVKTNQKAKDLYYFSKDQPLKTPEYFLFSGSPLRPIDRNYDVLFGSNGTLPSYSISSFLAKMGVKKLHFIQVDSGGYELQLLKEIKELSREAIVIKVKTYHKRIRKGMTLFKELHQFMNSNDFELMSHHIYDGVLGDALFVKKKYIDAVFRSKEQ